MSAAAITMLKMVLMMLVGFVCAKLKVTGPEFNKYASSLMANVLLSATILKSIISLETTVSNGTLFYVFALYFIMMGIAYVLAKIMSKLLPATEGDRAVLLCLAMYMNVAFIGFPLVDAVYGPGEASFYACLSAMPFNMLMYSAGVISLRGKSAEKIGFKFLLNAPLIATLIGVVVFLAKISVPELLSDTISTLAGATVPISMIILGTSLGNISFKAAFDDWRIYVFCAVRLIICPIVVFYALSLFVVNEMLVGVITILSATPSAVVLTPLSIQYDKNEHLCSKGVFISTVLSAVTLPLIIGLLL